jgi:hypothetical protein
MTRYIQLFLIVAVAAACGDASATTPTPMPAVTAAPVATGALGQPDLSGVAIEVHTAPG